MREILFMSVLLLIGLPDDKKKDVLSHLFHLGCFVVDRYKEVSFGPDIKSHSHSLKTNSAYAVELILFTSPMMRYQFAP
jgi:hypothetical protein